MKNTATNLQPFYCDVCSIRYSKQYACNQCGGILLDLREESVHEFLDNLDYRIHSRRNVLEGFMFLPAVIVGYPFISGLLNKEIWFSPWWVVLAITISFLLQWLLKQIPIKLRTPSFYPGELKRLVPDSYLSREPGPMNFAFRQLPSMQVLRKHPGIVRVHKDKIKFIGVIRSMEFRDAGENGGHSVTPDFHSFIVDINHAVHDLEQNKCQQKVMDNAQWLAQMLNIDLQDKCYG